MFKVFEHVSSLSLAVPEVCKPYEPPPAKIRVGGNLNVSTPEGVW